MTKTNLLKAYGRGVRSVRLTGVCNGAKHGHLSFVSLESKFGPLDHAWLNNRAIGQMPDLVIGQKVSFIATLQSYKGCTDIRLEDAREIELL